MRTIIHLDNTDHNFEKKNLVTQKGGFDIYACKCGLTGKRYGLGTALQINGKKDLIAKCPLATPKVAPTSKKVRITNFNGCSSEFKNLTNGSEHEVVPCPKEQVNKYGDDIWVMGVTEPVRLLYNEYEEI